MKAIITLCILFLCVACGTKSTSETRSADTAKVIALDTIKAQPVDTVKPQEATPTQATVAEVKTEKKDPSVKTIRCKYLKLEAGDCLHYMFDCGDYGSALTTSLPKEQADMRNDLMAFSEDHGDAPYSNPKYVGKTFEIVHSMDQGDFCQGDGVMVKQQVPNLLAFKLVK